MSIACSCCNVLRSCVRFFLCSVLIELPFKSCRTLRRPTRANAKRIECCCSFRVSSSRSICAHPALCNLWPNGEVRCGSGQTPFPPHRLVRRCRGCNYTFSFPPNTSTYVVVLCTFILVIMNITHAGRWCFFSSSECASIYACMIVSAFNSRSRAQ